MKLNATILIAMFLALSGFTWGSSEEDPKSKSNTSSAYSSNAPTTSSYSRKTKTASSKKSMTSLDFPTTSAPAVSGAGDQRANAVRILTAGDEATRKARLESLTRLAKAVAAKKRAQEAQVVTDNRGQSSYQY